MGCCLTTPKSNNALPLQHSPESDLKNRAPPPPPSAFEEETVKEVLSETPILKIAAVVPNSTENREIRKQIEVEEVKAYHPTAAIKPSDDIVSEISEVSEMCSFTESFSTTMTEKKDDAGDGEVTQRTNQRMHRSPVKLQNKRTYPGEHGGVRERSMRSPARRSAPSPEKRSQLPARPGAGRTAVNQRRIAGSPNGPRRDPGEGSGRRSRSPVTRGDAGQRQNARYRSPTTTSTSRAGGKSPSRTAEFAGGKSPVRKVEYSGPLETEKENDIIPEASSESLDNPLVSLECFIFL